MPVPTDNGSVFWFRHGSKWGVLSREGMVLFKPRFKDHVLGRGESDYDWNHPDGLDFKHQRAWVMEGKDFLLISNEGKILTRQRFIDVQEWTDQLYVFTNLKGGVGLISKDGKIVIPAMYHAIRSPVEGRAVVGRMINKTMPNGATDTFWEYGYIDEHGKMIVAPGTFNGPGVENGGQTELAPFSENFAPVSNNDPESSKRQIYDPCAGYIDPSGALMIPKSFYLTRPFSEGLGAVQERKPRQNMSHEGGLWGYVDKTGGMVIAPQFAHVTPFCRSRAWALKAGARWEEAQWAMIDQTGKALTDFSYEPPERGTNWHSFGEKDNRFMKSRWLGKFAIIKHSDFHNGLATAEGKMIAEPIYNRIGEFHDGVAVAVDSRQHNGQGRVTFITSLITALGEVLAKGTYSEITDFKHGIAWATHQHDDDRNGQLERMGWGLIDTSAREICEPKYVIASWVRGPNHDYTKKSPTFYDELAPVTISSDYKAEGRVSHGWGYINQAGKVVVWDENIPGR